MQHRATGVKLAGIALVSALALAAPAPAHDVSVVADGLDNPRGMDFAPNGDLYVAESGRGGPGPCVPAGGPGIQCFGTTGAVTRIDLDAGTQRRVTTGLPSLAGPGGSEAGGPSDVSFRDRRRGLLTIGLHAEVAVRDQLPPAGARMAELAILRPNGFTRPLADLGAFEAAENPDDQEAASNPNSVVSTKHGRSVVVDASGNDALEVSRKGTVSLLAVVPGGIAPSPDIPDFPEPLPPPGTPIPYSAVPTSVVQGPDGAYYVGQLTGFPFPEGLANVYRIVPGEEPEVYETGFTHITDLGFGPDGSLYVLQLSDRSLLFTPPGEQAVGKLIRVRPDGTRSELAPGALETPTNLLVTKDGTSYVSNRGASAGIGQVLKITADE